MIQMEVWIYPTHREALKQFLASLPVPSPQALPGEQLALALEV
jgi:hypothetical protein